MVGNFHKKSAYDHEIWKYFEFNLLKRYPILVDIITQSNSMKKFSESVEECICYQGYCSVVFKHQHKMKELNGVYKRYMDIQQTILEKP